MGSDPSSAAGLIPARNHDADREIERFLDEERRAGGLRILRAGIVALLLGTLGTAGLLDWWIHDGPPGAWKFAGPFVLLAGLALTCYGVAALARASADRRD